MIRHPFSSGTNNRYRRWSRGVAWLLACLAGSLAGGLFVLTQTSFGVQLPPTTRQLLLWLAGGGIAGLITGGCQTALLPVAVPRRHRWLVATLVGSALGWVVAHPLALSLARSLPLSLRYHPMFPWNTAVHALSAIGIPVLVNLSIAVAQCSVLRSQPAAARRWLIGSMLAMLVSWLAAIWFAQIAAGAPVRPIFQLVNYNWGEWLVFYLAGALASGVHGAIMLVQLQNALRAKRIWPGPAPRQTLSIQ